MNIRQLNDQDREAVKNLFVNPRYMGRHDINEFYLKPQEQHDQNTQYYHNFVNAYLTGLPGYTALGAWVNDHLVGLISAYQSTDEPSWYYTQIKSTGHSKFTVTSLLDHMIEFQESQGRLKFYSLWNLRYQRSMRKFAVSSKTQNRYDYFDEYVVPDRHKCFYNHHWQILFNRVLLPVDTVVRCTFLKQQYRQQLPVGGGL